MPFKRGHEGHFVALLVALRRERALQESGGREHPGPEAELEEEQRAEEAHAPEGTPT